MLVDLVVDLLLDVRVGLVDVVDGRRVADLLGDHDVHLLGQLVDARLGFGDLRLGLGEHGVVLGLGLVELGGESFSASSVCGG